MKSVIVIGVHRSGTSLVSNVLRQLGVNMGSEFLAPDEGNPGGYWEDTEWLGINKKILGEAKGSWRDPPQRKLILHTGRQAEKLIEGAVARRDHLEMWGFKDPRTCLTAEVFHKYLPDPHYIIVKRAPIEIVKSLKKLHGKNPDTWGALIKRYQQHIHAFHTNMSPRRVAYVQYEDLVTSALVRDSIYWLAGWLDIGNFNMGKVINVIKARR